LAGSIIRFEVIKILLIKENNAFNGLISECCMDFSSDHIRLEFNSLFFDHAEVNIVFLSSIIPGLVLIVSNLAISKV
jgi:hypothetical protein